jgi:hypothetical protein
MGRLRYPDPPKWCEACGKRLARKRSPGGALESNHSFRKRKYCNHACFWVVQSKKTMERPTTCMSLGRRRARRIKGPGPCERCGSTRFIDVHHKNRDELDNAPENLERLCRSCHHREHHKPGSCSVCGQRQRALGFCPKHYERFKKHGDPSIVLVGGRKRFRGFSDKEENMT